MRTATHPNRSMQTIDYQKSIYKNNYLSCDLPGYPCPTLAEKPLITVGYPTYGLLHSFSKDRQGTG